ncbi:uncharacterized protein PHALS_13617 [Plasmopara halstedii]|uniref:Uncharacterized protein n=1 Tax=Plasmopara halstedii TaxID=4781 RepID=A0A0P1AQ48_PLAHL|nr:uncharacterized protein PHALS_13617 [Plasmopara halstedii]CEG43420.1 hypothetical protein PHALS_13617 [Plasmopara halstedii]|eukprot:XP_024579789.1 hypothetical protein PHALS_13617 [Plasmopara halstedii]
MFQALQGCISRYNLPGRNAIGRKSKKLKPHIFISRVSKMHHFSLNGFVRITNDFGSKDFGTALKTSHNDPPSLEHISEEKELAAVSLRRQILFCVRRIRAAFSFGPEGLIP